MKKSILIGAALLVSVAAGAQKRQFAPPVMGWSSWNTLALNINEKNICANADAQVSSGLKDAGYVYCNIDDGYMGGRDAQGNMTSNDELFPHGMKYVADYIRSKGLIPGIYNDAGGNTCGSPNFKNPKFGQNVGFYGHEAADCDTYFNKWGYDFVKVDYCGASGLNLQEEPTYTAIGNAIKAESRKLGKNISYNICRWAFPGVWCRDVADSWRISGDIQANWPSFKYIIGKNRYLSAYCGDGHYNDMDMLEIGQGMPLNEEEVHMAIWCIQSSPLLVGCDMTKIPAQSLELMKNKEMIAVDQDVLGLQGYVAWQKEGAYIYVKDIKKLNGDTRAVALLNLSDEARTIDVPLSVIDMEGKAVTRDLIHHTSGPQLSGRITETLPARSVKMWTVKGKRIERTVYDAGTAYMPLFNDLGHNKEIIRYSDDAASPFGMKVCYLGNSPKNVMQWKNVYSTKGGKYDIKIYYSCAENRFLKIKVNGSNPVIYKELNTGAYNKYDFLTVTCNLKKGNNIITLGCDNGYAPDIAGAVLVKK